MVYIYKLTSKINFYITKYYQDLFIYNIPVISKRILKDSKPHSVRVGTDALMFSVLSDMRAGAVALGIHVIPPSVLTSVNTSKKLAMR